MPTESHHVMTRYALAELRLRTQDSTNMPPTKDVDNTEAVYRNMLDKVLLKHFARPVIDRFELLDALVEATASALLSGIKPKTTMGCMLNMSTCDLRYKGFELDLELIQSEEAPESFYLGRVKHISDRITFKANSFADIPSEFAKAVDEYLEIEKLRSELQELKTKLKDAKP